MSVFRNINLYIIFTNTICAVAGISLIVPDLPVLARQFNVPASNIGLVITASTLPGVILVLLFGVLADRFGRKLLMIPSLLLFSITGGAVYWANDFQTIIILRFFQGIGSAILPSMSTMLIGDLFEEKDRLKVMGLNSAVLSIGTALFPFIGGIMASVNWKTPFLAFWGVAPVALFIMAVFKEPRTKDGGNMGAYFKMSLDHLLKKSTILAYATGLVIFILLYGGILTYLTLYMDRTFRMDAYHIGMFIASASFSTAWLAPFAHRLERRFGPRKMFIAGFLLFTISFVSVLFVTQKEWMILPILVFGAAMGVTVPLLQSIVTSLAPFQHRGVLVSMLAMLIRLGQTMGPPLLGLLIVSGNFSPVFLACGAVAASFAIVVYCYGFLLEPGKNGQDLHYN